ncbi:hypothetical protein CC78DRAFT_536932 [Lojkania enalia]|uniref:Uncharacterized protein n=1 Tax=Lojkania enalia TaxID=147567 RepID=A0A9P4K0B5_9PLEO|nr:hypothetical protein CC78DRAFT_536932 [Didymosphaeria enalia]
MKEKKLSGMPLNSPLLYGFLNHFSHGTISFFCLSWISYTTPPSKFRSKPCEGI